MNRSPLHQFNLDHGARLVDFGGWEMPIQYRSVLEEHRAVRESVGFFDVSHLGRFSLHGHGARAALDRLLCNNLARIGPGRAQYTMMLNDGGGVIDDIIVWWWDEDRFWVMPNAANQPRVMAAFGELDGCEVEDLQMTTAMIAIQGPESSEVFERVIGVAPGRFRTGRADWRKGELAFAGTGYTGEKGGEIITDPATANLLAQALIDEGVAPCGLGARDTLRLEAGFPLWGQDLDESRSPLEADLGFAVDFEHEFVGKTVLEHQATAGVTSLLTGFVLTEKGVPRHGYPVVSGESRGSVTSGNISPVLGTGIGMVYLSPPVKEGTPLSVDIRGRAVQGETKRPPFHK